MAIDTYREGYSDVGGAVVAVVANIGAARGYRASANRSCIPWRARSGRCRAWRTTATDLAIGANQPITNKTSRFDCDSSTQIIDICGLSDPGTIRKVLEVFIE